MPDVSVEVTDVAIITVLNRQGGAISNFRDDAARRTVERASVTAPVNDPLNAMHRGGGVGDFAASFGWERGRSGNQHIVRAIIYNSSDHAIYAEEGRGSSSKRQTFSWANWGGETRTVRATGGWAGHHTLRDAANAVVASMS